MYEMRALTLFDPWATFVAHGVKKFETRSFQVSYRGPLVIHTSQRFTQYQKTLCTCEPYSELLLDLAVSMGDLVWNIGHMPRGTIIGLVDLVSVHRVEDVRGDLSDMEIALGDYNEGRFAWRLENPMVLRQPIKVRGALGLWTPSEEIQSQIHRERLEHDIEIVPTAHI